MAKKGDSHARERLEDWKCNAADEHTAYFDALHAIFEDLSAADSRIEPMCPWPWPWDTVSSETDPAAIAFEAAMYAIECGIVCPAWAADVVAAGWSRFRSYEVGTLGEAFGIAPHVNRKARKNKKDRHRDENIADEVESLKAGGLKHGKAVSRVAKSRGKSQKAVELAITSTRKMDAMLASDEPPEIDVAGFRTNN